jgi:NAD(P)-dependent dehydrogenase (short-subunit alcohol dehydrogenase family)
MSGGGRLEGKVIVLAGCGGIGDGLARRYAAEGAAVVIGDLRARAAADLAEEIRRTGGRAVGLPLDGAEEASVAGFFEQAAREFGGLDGCHVNFAALDDAGGGASNVLDISMAVYDRTLAVNARGYVLCTRAALPLLIARGGGGIVYTSSGAAHLGSPLRVAYAMSKAAGHALMRHVAATYGAQGVRANVIAPGYIAHPKLEALNLEDVKARALASTPYKLRLGRPDDIAALGALLLSDDGAFISGQVIAVDGGSTMRP